MEKIIKMPKLSSNMKKGVLAAWNKEIGEEVKKGEILFEVETDKVVSEVESAENGVLKKIMFDEGDEVDVDEIVAIIDCK